MHPNYFLLSILYRPLGNKTNRILNHTRPDLYWSPAYLRPVPIFFTYNHPRFERPIHCVGSASRCWFPKSRGTFKTVQWPKQERAKLKEGLREKSWFIENCSLPGVVSRADCQGSTFHLPDMIEVGGCVTKVCVCVWRGLSACVSGPPGTPLPEVGRAYVSYLRKSFSVAETERLIARMLCWKWRKKNYTHVYLKG